jgi:hypothetical protein
MGDFIYTSGLDTLRRTSESLTDADIVIFVLAGIHLGKPCGYPRSVNQIPDASVHDYRDDKNEISIYSNA